jgi:hypothetical protein
MPAHSGAQQASIFVFAAGLVDYQLQEFFFHLLIRVSHSPRNLKVFDDNVKEYFSVCLRSSSLSHTFICNLLTFVLPEPQFCVISYL